MGSMCSYNRLNSYKISCKPDSYGNLQPNGQARYCNVAVIGRIFGESVFSITPIALAQNGFGSLGLIFPLIMLQEMMSRGF